MAARRHFQTGLRALLASGGICFVNRSPSPLGHQVQPSYILTIALLYIQLVNRDTLDAL